MYWPRHHERRAVCERRHFPSRATGHDAQRISASYFDLRASYIDPLCYPLNVEAANLGCVWSVMWDGSELRPLLSVYLSKHEQGALWGSRVLRPRF